MRELSDANLPAQEKSEYKESETKRQVLDGRYLSIARVAVEEGGGELGWSQELWALKRSGMSGSASTQTDNKIILQSHGVKSLCSHYAVTWCEVTLQSLCESCCRPGHKWSNISDAGFFGSGHQG